MIYIANREQPEYDLGILDVMKLAARFALAVSAGLVTYAYLWIW